MSTTTKGESLDQALLFLSTFVVLLPSVYLLSSNFQLGGILRFLPYIITAVLMPLYVGYMRGGIELDSTCERARGWVYLAVGSGFYSLFLVLRQIPATTKVEFMLPILLLEGIGLFVIVEFPRRMVIWIYKVLSPSTPISIGDKAAIVSTAFWALEATLPFTFVEVFSGLFLITELNLAALSLILFISLILFPLVLNEVNCHKYVEEAGAFYLSRPAVVSSKASPKSSDYFARRIPYIPLTTSMLVAGKIHRKEYLMMLGGLGLVFLGGVSITVDPYSIGPVLAVAIETSGWFVAIYGLWRHATTDSKTLSTNRLSDWVFRILGRAALPRRQDRK